MFSDEAQEAVEFLSSWKTQRSVKDGFAQTSEIITYEANVQSVHKVNQEVQTEEDEDDKRKLIFVVEDEKPDLVNFIRRVYPEFSQQLQLNITSHAFDGFEVDLDESASAVSCLYTLTNADLLEEELQVTGLSWNSTGSVVAASYGRFDHEDWCTHKSALCTWNIDRRNIDPNKPDVTIDLAISNIFDLHNMVHRSVLLVLVNIWQDYKKSYDNVLWTMDPSSKASKYQVISISGDGKVLVWQMSPGSRDLKLVSGFILQTDSVPRSMRLSKARGDAEIGVTSMSFSHEDRSLFILGSEAGGVFKCSITARAPPLTNTRSSVPLRSPVTFAFSPHFGPVFSVDCSPHHRNLVLTCGTDASIRLYSMLQSKPLFSVEPGAGYLFRVRWSPSRPLVFSAVTGDGRLLIYDLKVNRINPSVSLEVTSDKSPVYSLEYNLQRYLSYL
ncbi:PREDICTED: WD repeat-containing protein 34-like [Acropora digitifera]|uniref:WD repeat-containing protein 34-like n=1 Tax=Acropora digitifera TaxID=70779 RepID=UPI00077A3BC7|nr:PREDICTED: WD repeat-containing protein 34-like [Acropora digitifera]